MKKTVQIAMIVIISLLAGYKALYTDKASALSDEPALKLLSHIQSTTQENYSYTLKQSGYIAETRILNSEQLERIVSALDLPFDCIMVPQEEAQARTLECTSDEGPSKIVIKQQEKENGVYYLVRLEGIVTKISMDQLESWTRAVEQVFYSTDTGYGWNVLIEAELPLHASLEQMDFIQSFKALDAAKVDDYTDRATRITSYYAGELGSHQQSKDDYANLQLIEHEDRHEQKQRVILAYPMISSEF